MFPSPLKILGFLNFSVLTSETLQISRQVNRIILNYLIVFPHTI